jgi:putative flippase GtrA
MNRLRQMARFAVVGTAATATHVSVGLVLAEGFGFAPFWANLAAFATAVLVSYAGNLVWTFGMAAEGFGRLPRFVALALCGLAANQSIVFAAVDLAGWSYRVALVVVVLVVPVLTYLASCRWVFQPALPSTAD